MLLSIPHLGQGGQGWDAGQGGEGGTGPPRPHPWPWGSGNRKGRGCRLPALPAWRLLTSVCLLLAFFLESFRPVLLRSLQGSR